MKSKLTTNYMFRVFDKVNNVFPFGDRVWTTIAGCKLTVNSYRNLVKKNMTIRRYEMKFDIQIDMF